MTMVNTNYNSTDDMINNLQSLKGKINLKLYKNKSNYYNEMKHENFQTQEDPFAKNAQGISKTHHEVLLLMTFLQTKTQVKIININYYDLFYTVFKTRDETDNNENDYINFIDFITPNHYIWI